MAAIAVLFFISIYLFISCGVIALAVRLAGRWGRSKKLWGIVAALIMYHLVFWDLIPNYLLFNYYVHTRSGFWVYKTPEQWKEENPGVAETLTWSKDIIRYKPPGYHSGIKLNERIASLLRKESTPLLPVWTSNNILMDIQTGQVLVKRTRIYTKGDTISSQFLRLSQDMIAKKEWSVLWDNYQKIGTEIP